MYKRKTCKNNTFNGMPLPPIWAMDENGTCRELVKFGYSDFKMRLGRAADVYKRQPRYLPANRAETLQP